jgi:outer membrane protein assembly factor BamB
MTRLLAGCRIVAMTLVLAACGTMSGVAGQGARGDADPIVGRWLGDATFGTDRVVIGLVFRRDDKGALTGTLYQPVMNLYAMPLPGTFVQEQGRYVNAENRLSLALEADTLSGTWSSLAFRVSLRRADALPAEASLRDVPRGPGPRWSAKLGAPIYAAAAVHDGIAYVGTTGGVFHAVRVADGTLAWTFNAGRAVHGQSLASDAHVYFACDAGYLFKLDRATGHEVWRYDLGDAQVPRVLPHTAVYDYDYQAPRPLLIDGTVYVGSGDGAMHAVDAGSGRRVWRHATGGKVRVGAIAAGRNIVFGSLDNKLYAVDAASGALAWSVDLKGPVTTTPALAGDLIAVGSRASMLYALRPATGEIVWRNPFWGSWVESEAVEREGVLYIGSSDLRRVSAIDPRDGRVLWRTDVFGSPWGRPLVTAGNVYVGAVGTEPYMMRHVGGVAALDRASGRLLWRWSTPDAPGALQNGFAASPALDGNTLVIGGLDGSLYAFDVR